jgi:hypothetical protein
MMRGGWKKRLFDALRVVALLACLLLVVDAAAQRRVTPVKAGSKNIVGINENKQPGDSIDRSRLVQMVDDKGNKILVDTVSGKEVPDTIGMAEAKGPKMKYPLLYSATVGVDIWDPLMRAFGQSYGIIGFSAEVNLHNRYIPVFEVGLGNANSTPSNQNYTYKVGMTPYFRLGMNYNFLFNGNPDYQFVGGIRFGWSHFNYQLCDVNISDNYWGEDQTLNFPQQTSSVTYMHVLFGLRVKIWKAISMGWNLRFRAILHETTQPNGKPWYIPGYGARGGIMTGSFSVFYTFDLAGKKKEAALPPGFEIESSESLTTPDAAPQASTESSSEASAAPSETEAVDETTTSVEPSPESTSPETTEAPIVTE